MATKKSRIDGASNGFEGDTIFILEDGTKYRQTEYYYWYRYEFRPRVTVVNDREIILNGIDKSIRVKRIY